MVVLEIASFCFRSVARLTATAKATLVLAGLGGCVWGVGKELKRVRGGFGGHLSVVLEVVGF